MPEEWDGWEMALVTLAGAWAVFWVYRVLSEAANR